MSGGGADPNRLKEIPSHTKGIKFTSPSKQQWYRMPLKMLRPLADAYCIGGAKYPPFNCLLEFPNGDADLWDATIRHLEECQLNPLAVDPEDGCYHAAKAAFSILARLHNAQLQKGSSNASKD